MCILNICHAHCCIWYPANDQLDDEDDHDDDVDGEGYDGDEDDDDVDDGEDGGCHGHDNNFGGRVSCDGGDCRSREWLSSFSGGEYHHGHDFDDCNNDGDGDGDGDGDEWWR